MTAPDVRTAAHTEAEQTYPKHPSGESAFEVDFRRSIKRNAFVKGAVWGAAYAMPTREQIAEELSKHKLIHVAVSRKSAFCTCSPGVTAGVDDNKAWFEMHQAGAVLALLAGLADVG